MTKVSRGSRSTAQLFCWTGRPSFCYCIQLVIQIMYPNWRRGKDIYTIAMTGRYVKQARKEAWPKAPVLNLLFLCIWFWLPVRKLGCPVSEYCEQSTLKYLFVFLTAKVYVGNLPRASRAHANLTWTFGNRRKSCLQTNASIAMISDQECYQLY